MTDRLFCAKPGCRAFGRHLPDCAGEDCRGCQPRPAADGRRLCLVDEERVGTDATTIADLYDELAHSVMPSGNGHGQPIGRSSEGPPAPRDKVVAIRTEIRHSLVAIAREVMEERGITGPADTVKDIGSFVARHAQWLAAQPTAGEWADELQGLRNRAWSIAYPNGTKVVPVGPCPRPPHHALEELPRGFIGPPRLVMVAGTLRAIMRPRDEGLLPSEVVCDLDPEHRWASSEWRQLDRLVSGRRAA